MVLLYIWPCFPALGKLDFLQVRLIRVALTFGPPFDTGVA